MREKRHTQNATSIPHRAHTRAHTHILIPSPLRSGALLANTKHTQAYAHTPAHTSGSAGEYTRLLMNAVVAP
jgi:hypothetical protein